MNTLEKKLIEKSKKVADEGENIVKDVKLLLADEAAQDLAVLKSIGLDAHVRIAQKKQEDVLIRTQKRDDLNRPIVHLGEIAKLCRDYRLYLGRTDDYMGVIPPELASELARYCKEYNIPLPSNSTYSNFRIIAPPKMFKGYMNPWEVLADAAEVTLAARAERIRRIKEDPILVYKLDNNSDYYAVIKSWGEDFTPLRRFYGFMTKPSSVKWINFLSTMLILFLSFKIVRYAWVSLSALSEAAPNKTWAEAWPIVALVGICIVFAAFNLIWFISEDASKFRRSIMITVTRTNHPKAF